MLEERNLNPRTAQRKLLLTIRDIVSFPSKVPYGRIICGVFGALHSVFGDNHVNSPRENVAINSRRDLRRRFLVSANLRHRI